MFEDIIHLDQLADEEAEMLPLFSIDDTQEDDWDDTDLPETLPLLAVKNTVLFPNIVVPITVGRDKSIHAVKKANSSHRYVAVVAQKSHRTEEPTAQDLYDIGVIARIVKVLKMPDGTTTVILQGRQRMQVTRYLSFEPHIEVEVAVLAHEEVQDAQKFTAMTSSIRDLAQRVIKLAPNIPSEAAMILRNISTDSFLLNFIASNLNTDVATKQLLLGMNNLEEKAETILEMVNQELQILEIRDQIENKVRGDMEKQQRDYFLNQQLKTIQEELGQNPQTQELDKIEQKAKNKDWPEAVAKQFRKEIEKLRRINPAMPEYSIQLNYLELVVDLPWNTFTKDNFNLKGASQTLDKAHFGLKKVKDRILEHLAVLKLKKDMKAPILCLVGPPGVGKTSLGKSVAKALGREYVRMSLGGLRDESEIRGHRKTYIGAMPGRIIQSLRKAGASNPVFILDEIDKIGSDFRGDPSSALLEVLDPEQNTTFYDNYLEMEYDLSKVLFIATANSLNSIQPALLDRMEIIEVNGYSQEEKFEIAKRHLIPAQRKDHGLTAKQIRLNKKTMEFVIDKYTRESGVRNLNRQIANIMRHTAKSVAMEEEYTIAPSPESIQKVLGMPRFTKDHYEKEMPAGVTVGLAWTQVGGDILYIEASLSPGKGKLTLTGNLGDVMKESATTAMSYLRAHAQEIGIPIEDFESKNVHVHVPAGAIPKDGPSAGITMLTALTSAFLNKPVAKHLAMTGEITLRGRVLPVGGIKEKVLAARRAGITQIILCGENQKDISEINEDYIKDLTFHYVHRAEEVLKIAFK